MSQKSNNTPDCMNEFDPDSLTVDQAIDRLAASATPISGAELVSLPDSLNRILRDDVLSPINVPPYANSAMDGYAINSADLPTPDATVSLTLVGTAMAGRPCQMKLEAGQCIRIMTGAQMPEGADTVVMQEHITRNGDTITLSGNSGYQKNANVRYPGEDLSKGQIVLGRGRRLTAADVGLLASIGIAKVNVIRRLRVAFFSTGDELRSLGETLKEGQIYDSNRYTLHAMLTRLGHDITDLGIIPDDIDAIRAAFTQAANSDVIITSGGVSVGDADYVKMVLEEIGKINFWKIAMKPGKPLAYGRIGKSHFFGLPGNPVSTMVTFYQFVQPTLALLSGEELVKPKYLKIPCRTPLKKRPGRVDYQRGIVSYQEDGSLVVESTGTQGSNILSSMSQANCFIVLPRDSSGAAAGDVVDVQLFDGLI